MTDDDRDKAAETPAEGPDEVVAPPVDLDKTGSTPAESAEAAPAPAPVPGEAEPEAETAGRKTGKAKKKGHWLDDLKAILCSSWPCSPSTAASPALLHPVRIDDAGLLKGDRLVVSKYPIGWSWVSPSFHIFPRWQGRIWGEMPRRGDIVIVTPPGENSDYIKRVIGLPGDTIQVVDGVVILNGRALITEPRPPAMIPMDANVTCGDERDIDTQRFRRQLNGRWYCQLPVVREYLPDGRYYDTINTGPSPGDEYPREGPAPVPIPAGHVFMMGDNRDHSADSRFPAGGDDKGLGGPVPWENIGGRAEFITFSLDGSSSYWNPVSWFTALRGGRAGTSLHPASGPPRQGAPRP